MPNREQQNRRKPESATESEPVSYRLFGEVLKLFGAGGEVLVKLDEYVAKRETQQEEPVFMEFSGLRVPFYFKLFEQRGRKAKVIFENMESELLAAELAGKKIFIPASPEPEAPEEKTLVGFAVMDARFGMLGRVAKLHDFPGNPCIEVAGALIPLNGISRPDYAKSIVYTEIPDGLFSL
jgi:ribosomal 30S subunit maturation factor RimM